ncbi:hypothetical protein NL676_034667 [Syzygium grande]|nr:hypothetical protein NL676_034667 [Syzygium grande]
MESSCSSLDSAASLLSIVASVLTIAAFGLSFLHERVFTLTLTILLRNYLGRRGRAGGGAGRAEGSGGEGEDGAGGHEQGAAEPEPVEQGEGAGELLEVLKTRAERNEKYGGGPSEECRAEQGGGGGGGDGDFCLVIGE